MATDAIAISDLHLGSDVCQADNLVRFLEKIRKGKIETQRLILNGDVFDSIDFRRLKKSHWKVLSLLRKLSNDCEVTWVCGNHDGCAETISHLLGLNVVQEIAVESEGKQILFLHGHQFDRFIEKYPLATRFADTVYRLVQKLDPTHSFAKAAKRRSKVFLRSTEAIRLGATEYASQKGYDAVCCGHTHAAMENWDGAVPYFNSGCWTESPCHYLVLEAGEVRVEEFFRKSSLAETVVDDELASRERKFPEVLMTATP